MIDEMRENNDYTVMELIDALDVSKSGYYAAKPAPESPRKKQQDELLAEIKAIHEDRHTCTYGSPRMTAELNARDLPCSENRVAQIMARNGIRATNKAAFRPKTTVCDPKSAPSPNLLKDAVESSAPGEAYVSDITYVATREGWLYLAVVLDLYSRKVAGWAIAEHMEARLVTSALCRAVGAIRPVPEALFHSDRGCQYTSGEMRQHLRLLGMTQSMSAKGYCYDNAINESFFATLKREAFPDDYTFDTKAQAKSAIFDYIETFYNRRRRHSTLGYLSPEDFIKKHFQKQKQNLN